MDYSLLMIIVFVLGYAAIAMEHSIKIDKAASAILLGVLCWTLYVFSGPSHDVVEHGKDIHNVRLGNVNTLSEGQSPEGIYQLHLDSLKKSDPHFNPEESNTSMCVNNEGDIMVYEKLGKDHQSGLVHHLFDIAMILFFLMGAMTIVELIDAYEGFNVITDKINTTSKIKLMWIVTFITFFLSAALDNLTTAIVMISVLRKLIDDKQTRWFFAGMVIVAANAGGAWSPIGDVTTTMLWIKGQLPDTGGMIMHLIVPSLTTIVIPLLILSFTMKGTIQRPAKLEEHLKHNTHSNTQRNLVFILGIGGLLFVPVFKTITHLPPFMGMMLSLGILWVVTELMHKNKSHEDKKSLSVIGVLQKIDTASVLFFLGILLAVAALQEVGHLLGAAKFLDAQIIGMLGETNGLYGINIVIGLMSAIVDNVPLVAAAQGMYPIAAEGAQMAGGSFWEFLAYCAGTGGSCLIIGSAAGVAVMGLEKISFGWYLSKMSFLALAGYLGGAIVYILMQ